MNRLAIWTAICIVPFVAPVSSANEFAPLADSLIEQADMNRGICAFVGRDGDLPLTVAEKTEWLVHVRDPNRTAVRELMQSANRRDLNIRRLAATSGSLAELPYANNIVDCVFATRADAAWLDTVSVAEVLRVLRPEGKAIVGQRREGGTDIVLVERLNEWATNASAENVISWTDDHGTWVQLSKKIPAGIDEWPQWEKGPDNNPVSEDTVIKAPYLLQFAAKPYFIGMPSITTAAGGRTFLAVGHTGHHPREWASLGKLIARNGYNGTILWERDLPEGYLAHRSAFYATKDTFHLMDKDRCLLLDAKTGEEKGEIRIPDLAGEWKWMAFQDNVLYVLAGEPDPGVQTKRLARDFGGWVWSDVGTGLRSEDIEKKYPFGFGDTLAAFDLNSKRVLWTHSEETVIDSRGLAVESKRLFLYCPKEHYRCLDRDTGDVVWTNDSPELRELIERDGRKLRSTPGWMSQTMAVATPDALIVQGQARKYVVALGTKDGKYLWKKEKITRNPNAVYTDGKIVLGVGPDASHVVIDPVSGKVERDLGFKKVSCTRLTVTPGSFFCRGEGILRYDRESNNFTADLFTRPGCNDGVLPSHGLLYLGPWACDCNLQMVGSIARGPAGDYQVARPVNEDQQLFVADGRESLQEMPLTDADWPTYRANALRSAASVASLASEPVSKWVSSTEAKYVPTAPVTAGDLVLHGGDDGKIRALDSDDGSLRWEFPTAGVIKYPPTVWNNRAFFGSSDGYVYCVEAVTGKLLWQFRASSQERLIPFFGPLSSAWPVNSGVVVQDGMAYFAAGIIDTDGTYVIALDAMTGKVKWDNYTSGHLNSVTRKGVSAQGNVALHNGRLILAGGNRVNPATFDATTGEISAELVSDKNTWNPSNASTAGRFAGFLADGRALVGGPILYDDPNSSAAGRSNRGWFHLVSGDSRSRVGTGSIPPTWNERGIVFVQQKASGLAILDTPRLGTNPEEIRRGKVPPLELDWKPDLSGLHVETVVMASDAVVAILRSGSTAPESQQWFIAAFDIEGAKPRFQHPLASRPQIDALAIDRKGQIVVSLLDGRIQCFGAALPEGK